MRLYVIIILKIVHIICTTMLSTAAIATATTTTKGEPYKIPYYVINTNTTRLPNITVNREVATLRGLTYLLKLVSISIFNFCQGGSLSYPKLCIDLLRLPKPLPIETAIVHTGVLEDNNNNVSPHLLVI